MYQVRTHTELQVFQAPSKIPLRSPSVFPLVEPYDNTTYVPPYVPGGNPYKALSVVSRGFPYNNNSELT